MVADVVNLLTFIKQLDRKKMVKITWKGWRDEPDEDWHHSYDVLTGRKKPFYVVFGRPHTSSKQSEKDIDDQDELVHDDE
jgi:hypothetical protein